MEKIDRATHVLKIDGDRGEVRIADEVVAIIAGMAATDVRGVASMAGNIKNELVSMMGMKTLSKGVKVEVTDTDVKVDLALNLEFEANILKVSGIVQDKVKADRHEGVRSECPRGRHRAGIRLDKVRRMSQEASFFNRTGNKYGRQG